MFKNSIEFNVLVNGRRVNEYSRTQDENYKADGKVYVEGRKGSEYELQIVNRSSKRRKVVLSVDGLNVVTGNKEWERGYVVEGWSSLIIPGWRIDAAKASKFVFASVGNSYNAHNDSGEISNVGVIGCLVFDEVVQAAVWPNYVLTHKWEYREPTWQETGYREFNQNVWYDNSVTKGIGSTLSGTSAVASSASATRSAQNSMGDNPSFKVSGAASQGTTRRMQPADGYHSGMKLPKLCAADPEPPKQSVGTGWGDDKTFKTREVNFNFNSNTSETFNLFYDDLNGLRRRGILVERNQKPRRSEPDAFPGYRDGCPFPTK